MRIAFIGAGKVGAAIAIHLANAGHDVVLAESSDGSASVAAARARSSKLRAANVASAVAEAEVVFLATPYGANEVVLRPLAGALRGKVLVDCTNPVGPGLSHGLESKRSGAAVVQELAPEAKVVKAFTIYGYENLEEPPPAVGSVRPAMLFCGDDAAAKATVARLVGDVGFEPVDVGGLAQALHLEHMTLLWIRMVRAGGASPHTVWARLPRA